MHVLEILLLDFFWGRDCSQLFFAMSENICNEELCQYSICELKIRIMFHG